MTDPDDEPGEDTGLDPERAGATGPESGVHPAVYASNWRTVLAVDAAMGATVMIAGVVAAIVWNPLVGGVLGSLGLAYVAMVVRRGRQWADLRRAAGL